MRARLAVSLRGVSLRRGDHWVLRDITCSLRPGERWALLGDNGAGKTQFLKLLSGDIWPTPPTRPGLMYRLGKRPIELLEAKPRMAYIGAERQDKYARYGWNLSVRDVVATGLHQSDLLLKPLTRGEMQRVRGTLGECGIAALAKREFLSLSYGEKRLTLLGRSLVRNPDWLLLDEFYNGLDASYRRRIDAVLERARRHGQSWVATTHRAIDVPRGTRSLIELREGRIHAVKKLRREDSRRLVSRAGERSREARAVSRPNSVARCGDAARRAPVLIRILHADLYVEYRLVLKALSWQLRGGEHWSIFGANGAGKSSFLKLLYGDLAPALGGRIERRGYPRGTPMSQWKRRVGYVSPELQSTYAVEVSILELVASGRHASIGLNEPPTHRDLCVARHWLKFFRLTAMQRRGPRELSYGQLRRALVARAMAANPRLLLLDEPLTGLDPAQRAQMKQLLERLMMSGVTVIAAVHRAEDLPRGMTHGLHLHNRQAFPVDSYFAT